MDIIWTDKAIKQLAALPRLIQVRVSEKMKRAATLEQPFPLLIRLKDTDAYKVRIGDYRVIGHLNQNLFTVVVIGHRSKVYKEFD